MKWGEKMNKVRELRKEHRISQQKLAAILNVHQTAISQWETGRTSPDVSVATEIAKIFNVSLEYVLGINTEDVELKSYEEVFSPIRIPVYGNIAAGIPIEAIVDYDPDNADDWEEISEEMSRNGTYIALRIKGNSMEPRMKTGDVVIIRIQQDVDDGDIAAVRINGDDVTCKKIKKTEDGLLLLSINSDYEPLHFTPEQIESLPVVIIGKVVELRAKF